MFVIPGHPTPYGLIFFVCISCISLLFHNLATSLMEKVRDDDEKGNLKQHSEFMLHDLARDIASRRQGNFSQKIQRMMNKNFRALRNFVIVFSAKQKTDNSLVLHCQIEEHDGLYSLMNWIPTPARQS